MSNAPVYRQASYRGVPFEVEGESVTFGRRGPLHEYVNQDVPYFEDMGRRASEFRVTAFVRGANHLVLAQNLMDAINLEGEAELVLPSRQTEVVICTEAERSDDTRREGLVTRFELTFVEAGQFQFPTGLLDTIANLIDSAATAINAISADVRAPFSSLTSGLFRIEQSASRLGVSVASIFQIATDFEDVSNLIQSIIPGDTVSALNEIIELADFESAVAPIVQGPIAVSEYEQALEFDRAFRSVAALHAASVASQLQFSNRAEALSIRQRISDALIRDINDMTLEQVQAVTATRHAFIIDMTSRVAVLPAFATINLGQSLPSVVAAHRVFGDWTRESDLRTWNATSHPLFMDQVIEVLRD